MPQQQAGAEKRKRLGLILTVAMVMGRLEILSLLLLLMPSFYR